MCVPAEDDAFDVWQGEEAEGAPQEPRPHLPGTKAVKQQSSKAAKQQSSKAGTCKRVERQGEEADRASPAEPQSRRQGSKVLPPS